jgi:hypothetical protein
VKNRFQSLPFKRNLQRYTADEKGASALLAKQLGDALGGQAAQVRVVGRCRLESS